MSNQLQISGAAKIRSIQGPVVANSGVITALDGDASQYVRGDGTLADFPTSTGGGSSVSYYLNTSVSQGTIGGVAYKQLSKVPIAGAGTDVTISANGYIASYLTDANDPALLEVPAGNFNCEFYFSVNSNAHNPYVYAEVYKYDGTTFTLLGSSVSVPEYLTNGTTLSPYYFAIPVATSVLTITDRIAVRIYVNVDGRTVTLHTENNHLCQVVTTFSKGLTTLNSLTRQVQFFQTGTSGSDFNISSATATHTFNIPDASASARGLVTTSGQSFAGLKSFQNNVNINGQLFIFGGTGYGGGISYRQGSILSTNDASTTTEFPDLNSIKYYVGQGSNTYKNFIFDVSNITLGATRTYNLPDASGTIALTSSLTGYVPYTGATANVDIGVNAFNGGAITTEFGYAFKILAGGTLYQTGYSVISSLADKISFTQSPSAGLLKAFSFDISAWANNSSYTYTLPAANGTLAILEAGSQTFTGTLNVLGSLGTKYGISIEKGNTPSPLSFNDIFIYASSGATSIINFANSSYRTSFSFPTSNQTFTYPAATGTIALTSNLSSYVPYTGATGDVFLGTNSITGAIGTFTQGVINGNGSNPGNLYLKKGVAPFFTNANNYGLIAAVSSSFILISDVDGANYKYASFNLSSLTNNTNRAFTLPDATGTLALGTGTTNYVSKFTGTNTIGNSLIFDNGTNVGIGNTNTSYTLDVSGTGRFTGALTAASGTFTQSAGNSLQVYQTTATNSTTAIIRQTGSGGNGGQDIGLLVDIQGANDLDNIANFRYYNGSTYTSRMVIKRGGNVGIGNTGASDVRLFVTSGTSGASAYACFFRNSSSANLFFVRDDGYTFTGLASGSPYNYATTGRNAVLDSGGGFGYLVSTRESKTNIESIKNIDFINQLNPVQFNYRKKDNIDNIYTDEVYDNISYGFIADEVEKVNKELVFYNVDGTLAGVEYNSMIAILTKAIQEQQALITSLQARLDNAGL